MSSRILKQFLAIETMNLFVHDCVWQFLHGTIFCLLYIAKELDRINDIMMWI
jgi:hypothetical protein